MKFENKIKEYNIAKDAKNLNFSITEKLTYHSKYHGKCAINFVFKRSVNILKYFEFWKILKFSKENLLPDKGP